MGMRTSVVSVFALIGGFIVGVVLFEPDPGSSPSRSVSRSCVPLPRRVPDWPSPDGRGNGIHRRTVTESTKG